VVAGTYEEEPGTQSIHRAISVLYTVGEAPAKGIGLTDLARETDLSKASALRALRVLVDRNLLSFDEHSQRYRLGLGILALSSKLLAGLDVRAEALPRLEQLAEMTGETVHLGVLDAGEVVYIEKVESAQSVRMYSRVGKRMPAYCTGVGKALLAWLPVGDVDAMLPDELVSHDGRTVDREKLFVDLAATRRRGFAMDFEENERGISCVAAPVFDHRQNVVAAISVAGPSARMQPFRLEELGGIVREAADMVSTQMGVDAGVVV